MKVAIIHHYSMTFHRGGEKMIESIAYELSRRNHSVSIYSFPLHRRDVKLSFPFYYKECFSEKFTCDVAYFTYAPLIHRLFRTSAPKIAGIHSFITYPNFSHNQISSLEFLYRHGLLVWGAIFLSNITKNRDLRNFDAVHIPNIFPHRHTGVPIYAIPNWIDLQIFRPKKDKNDIFTIVFVGSKTWSKGYDIFCNIAKYLSKRISKIKFLSIGTRGNNESSSLIEEYPFIYQEDLLSEIYSSSHILVYPSRADIFGLTLLESLACGTPVLTSALPSHRAFLPEHFICLTFQDYINKILKIYHLWQRRSGEYDSLVKEARNIALNFDKNKLFPLFEKMLIEVANGECKR
ncbi:MAG: glycosyltransferase [Candidatus Methanomethylicaceae archaeon]